MSKTTNDQVARIASELFWMLQCITDAYDTKDPAPPLIERARAVLAKAKEQGVGQ